MDQRDETGSHQRQYWVMLQPQIQGLMLKVITVETLFSFDFLWKESIIYHPDHGKIVEEARLWVAEGAKHLDCIISRE